MRLAFFLKKTRLLAYVGTKNFRISQTMEVLSVLAKMSYYVFFTTYKKSAIFLFCHVLGLT